VIITDSKRHLSGISVMGSPSSWDDTITLLPFPVDQRFSSSYVGEVNDYNGAWFILAGIIPQ
jgi:hypothetical protein